MTPTIERLTELFDYSDAGNGALLYKVSRQGRPAGGLAGFETSRGELRVIVDGTSYLAAKVAWALIHGAWPLNRLRFLNGDRTDMRVENLEETARIDGPGRHG